jgi:hypothetical protein
LSAAGGRHPSGGDSRSKYGCSWQKCAPAEPLGEGTVVAGQGDLNGAMMTIRVTPTCRYGHGDLVRATAPGSMPNLFFVPVILELGQVNFGAGYVFELWKCAERSYIEHHDRVPMPGNAP